MGKTYFFFHGQAFSQEGEDKHITIGEGWRVDGGNKKDHDQVVEVTEAASKQFEEHRPETIKEAAEILGDVIKKVGKPERLR